MALRDAGRPDAARVPCMRALAILVKHSGPRHPDVANVLLELATIEQDRGAYAEALGHARRAAAILAPLRGDVLFDQLRFQALCRPV